MLLATAIVLLAEARLIKAYDCNNAANTEYTATSVSDAEALAAACPSYSWDLIIDPSVSGDVALDGIYTIAGGLFSYNSSGLTSIGSTTLSNAGEINIIGASLLQTVDFPSVTAVPAQQMGLYSLPSLNTLVLNQNAVYSLSVANTGVASVRGLGPGSVAYGTGIYINGNPNLEKLSLGITHLDYNTKGKAMELSVVGNAAQVAVDLPNLISVSSDTNLHDCSDLSIPHLTSVGGILNISNAQLSSVSAPSLANVGGALFLSGTFTEASFPALSHVAGNLYVQGGPGGIDCSAFQALSKKGGVGGSFHCGPTRIQVTQTTSSKVATSSRVTTRATTRSTAPFKNSTTTKFTTTTAATVTNSSSTTSFTSTRSQSTTTPSSPSSSTTAAAVASSGLSGAATGGIGAGAAIGVILLIAVLVWWLLRKRRKGGRQTQEIPHEAGERRFPLGLPSSRHQEQSGFRASSNQVSELTGSRRHLYSPAHQAPPALFHHPAELAPPAPVPMQYARTRGPAELGRSTPAPERPQYHEEGDRAELGPHPPALRSQQAQFNRISSPTELDWPQGEAPPGYYGH